MTNCTMWKPSGPPVIRQRNAIKMAFRWRAIVVRFLCLLGANCAYTFQLAVLSGFPHRGLVHNVATIV